MQTINLEQAIYTLKQGDVLAYPTEAVWGLGCDPRQEHAFQKILTLKQRPIEKGVILLSESIERVEPLLVGLDTTIRNQVIASWEKSAHNQRAHTWLLPTNDEIPAWIYGDHDRVAIRVTNHSLCQQLCRSLDDFVVSTSANPAGLSPATSASEVQKYFSDQVAILSGELGDSPEPSRIVDAVTGQVIRA